MSYQEKCSGINMRGTAGKEAQAPGAAAALMQEARAEAPPGGVTLVTPAASLPNTKSRAE